MDQVVIYSRVSTDEQADKGYSMRAQEERLTGYCSMKGYSILNHFMDDYSAKTFERPAFIKLLEFLKQKKNISKLIVVKWDRFSRNITDALQMIKTLHKINIEVVAIEQPIDWSIPEQKMMLAIYLAAPEIENERRSMNTISGMRRAMKEGRWLVMPPMGYVKQRDSRNKPIIVPGEKSRLIKEAFEMYATGNYHLEEVRSILEKKGLKLCRAQFWTMIRNPVYYGKIEIKAYKDEPKQLVDGIHTPIISEKLFNEVQRVAKGKAKIKSKTKKENIAFPLRGFLVCSKCGKNLTASVSRGNGGLYTYYHCQPGCAERHIAMDVHSTFSLLLSTLTLKPEVALLYKKILEDMKRSDQGLTTEYKRTLKMKINKYKEYIELTDHKFLKDEIDKENYDRMSIKYKTELKELNNQLFNSTVVLKDIGEIVHGFNMLSDLKNIYEKSPLNLKRNLISSIFPEKLIFENKKYRTTKPSEILKLLFNNYKGFQSNGKKMSAKNCAHSGRVASGRIELPSRV
jgi:site-specific DNA recombinase